MKRQLISIALASTLAAMTTGCHTEATARAEAAAAQPERLQVEVVAAGEREVTRAVDVQGALFPREHTIIASEITGPVAEVLADFGDAVEAGQPLLKIDPREYRLKSESARASFEQANARVAHAQADYDRGRELHTEKMMATSQFDQLSAGLKVAQADAEAADKALGLANKKLGDCIVRAPFKGFVQKRMVSLGEYVNPGDKLYEFIAIDPMKLRAPIPERFVPLAHVGLELSLTVEAAQGRNYSGHVTRIAPALDEASRTLLVEAEVPNPDGSLKPGYFAHVRVSLGQGRGLFVPESAVARYAGVERVFVIKNGIARSREVATGVQLGDQIEIVKGLASGEQVAISDIDRLADGAPVVSRIHS
jgi:membrane fusion protein (multidrug efflux system)